MALAARLLAPAARRAARLVLSDSTDAVTNLAIEDWLFRSAEPEAGPLLYCYRNAPTVVLGRNQNQWKQCRMGALRASGVALVRRNSGGGAVYHDLGNSNFCFIGDKEALGDKPGRMRHATLVADALREGFGLPTAVSEERLELVVAPDGPCAAPPPPPATTAAAAAASLKARRAAARAGPSCGARNSPALPSASPARAPTTTPRCCSTPT